MFDCIIVGSGLAGAVVAERLANKNKNVLVIEQRTHVGGNCYDKLNEYGILVHQYGPHLFHTNNEEVWKYLSNFTEWNEYNHYVKAFIDGKYVPIPFNLNTVYTVFPPNKSKELEQKLIHTFPYNHKISISKLMETKDDELNELASYIYEKVFKQYTEKQWGIPISEINQSVLSRVPIRISTDNRYFTDKYQAVPKYGYSKLIQKILNHPHIKIMLNTKFSEVMKFDGKQFKFLDSLYTGTVIYTGLLDELFGYKYGSLKYRSVDFKFDTILCSDTYLPSATVTYPNNYEYTRATEFKKIHPVISKYSTILREYPQKYIPGKNIPCYPVFDNENQETYQNYFKDSQKIANLVVLGRLAEYKYYDMDDIVSQALTVAKTL